MTHKEYDRFVKVTQRHGGRVVFYAEFPSETQKEAARKEILRIEEHEDFQNTL